MSTGFDLLGSEDREILQALAEQSHDCIKLISLDGDVQYVSDTGRARMAIPQDRTLIGRPWTELWPDECHPSILRAIAQASAGERTRFEAFDPDLNGVDRWWEVTVSPIRGETGAVSRLLATSRDITDQRMERAFDRERRAQAEAEADAHDVIAREMRHRLQNLLAIVGSIARLTGREAERTADFLPIFIRRLNDLSAAQYLLTEHSDMRADLTNLVGGLLGSDEGDERIRLHPLPPVRLNEHSARVIALIIGELFTNSRKYGALADERGEVDVMAKEGDGRVAFEWAERCERTIREPARAGSGTILMQRMSAREPEPLAIEWNPGGITARFAVRL